MHATTDWSTSGRWFDRDWYLARQPDVARAGIDPLAHYLRYGEAEGRFPSRWFDPLWYRSAYDVPADQSALAHFLTGRATGTLLPCAALYLVPLSAPWRDDIERGVDPFDHYLSETERPEQELLPELALTRASGLIGDDYFQINAADAFERELEPALHYRRFGRRHGARPSSAFEPDWYAATNPKVARLGIDPLTHYALEGEPAGRRPVAWFDPVWYRANHQVDPDELALAHYLRHRCAGTVSPNPLFDVDWYVARHGGSIPTEVDPFSHYLVRGAIEDVDPSPRFSARDWRHRHMAPLGADAQSELPMTARNPLVHHLRTVHVTD